MENDHAIIRRAAIVCIGDIVSAKGGLNLLGPYGEKIESSLKYIVDKDNDLLVREQAKQVLYSIDETFEETFKKGLSLHAETKDM